jgi:antitoxin (DNA-binding transcriptional repressor) of toxin-antitoxin stability system
MDRYLLENAREHLQELIAHAQCSETVVIVDEPNRAVQLIPVKAPATKPRKAGSARGQIKMSPDFDAPLSDFDDYMA